MVAQRVGLIVTHDTKVRFLQLIQEFKRLQPDYKVNQDFVLRKLMDKYEGDLQ